MREQTCGQCDLKTGLILSLSAFLCVYLRFLLKLKLIIVNGLDGQ